MILKITHKAARLLAIQDAKRAMKAKRLRRCELLVLRSLRRLPLRGLGDVLMLNPGAKLEDDVVQTYDAAYRDTWHRA